MSLLLLVLKAWIRNRVPRAAASTSRNVDAVLSEIAWLDEHRYTSGFWQKFKQKFQSLRRQLAGKKTNSRQVALRMCEAGDKTNFDRVLGGNEHNWERHCRGFPQTPQANRSQKLQPRGG